MLILHKNINIRFESLIKGMMCMLLLFLTGCTSATPEELRELIAVQKENCWPCTGYKVVWEALANLTNSAFPEMCGWALDFLGVALLFWITFTVGKFLVALKEPNIKDFITNMAMVLFKSFVVAVILMTPENTMYILDLIVTPTIQAFVNLARAMMFSDPELAKNFASGSSYDPITTESALFASAVGNQLQDVVYRIYLGFSSGIALGARMLISLDMLSWGLGFFVMFVFFYLMLIFPLIFMEGFIIVGIVFVMFPFFLVSYVFPATKTFPKVAWEALFVAVMQIVITCVYLTILISVVKNYSDSFSIGKQLTDFMFITGLKTMTNSALAFFALIYCMFRMASDIPVMTSFLTGTFNRSQTLAMVKSFTGFTKHAGKFIAGAAMVGTGVGSSMGTALMSDAGREMTQDFKGAVFGVGGDSGGGVTAEQAALGNGGKK